jgi:hypothetical protein
LNPIAKLLDITSRREGYRADVFLNDDGSIWFFGDMDMDWDGSPQWHDDPDGAPDTSLHYNGNPINSQTVPGIVLPPECIKKPKGVVLGCQGEAYFDGKIEPCVVFDVGPFSKLGEGTPELARRLGINPHYSKGGIDTQTVRYRYWPGVPAVVDGIVYTLKPYKS